MLTVYRRHKSTCENRQNRYFKKCKCKCWCEGTVEGKYRRESLKTTSWKRAHVLIRAIEDGKKVNAPKPITISESVAKFLNNAERGRRLRPATLKKYRVLLRQFEEFVSKHGVRYLKEFNLDLARQFQESWKESNISARKKLERLVAFCKHYVKSGDLAENYAKELTPPPDDAELTLPFEEDEVEKALEHAEPRWRALILVLRWSGLRIGDAMKLTPQHFDGNRLFLRTEKTGVRVFVPLPPFVMDALEKLPTPGGYYFWARVGESKLETATGNARRALRRIFKLAGIENGHPHRFRDSFAVALLDKGVPIETVAILLGHSDPRVTRKHYAPHVKRLQENLEREVTLTWPQPKLTVVPLEETFAQSAS